MRKLLLALSLLTVSSFAVSTMQTNLDVLGPGKALYGFNAQYEGHRIIGLDSSSDKVEIDRELNGTVVKGSLDIRGSIIASLNATLTTTATTNATINVTQAYGTVWVDTWQAVAISTVNALVGGVAGQEISFMTVDAGRDILFIDSAVLNTGANITLGDTMDMITFYCKGADVWVRKSNSDN